MANAFSGENQQVVDNQISTISDTLADTLNKELELLQVMDSLSGNDDRDRLAITIADMLRQNPPAETPLARLHRGFTANIEAATPTPDSPGLEHLAFFEAMLLTRKKAAPNPLTPEPHREEVDFSIDQSIYDIQQLRKIGGLLVDEWREAEGQHYVAKQSSDWKIGIISDTPTSAVRVNYGDSPPSSSRYADWLLGVGDDYINVALDYLGAGEAVAGMEFAVARRMVPPIEVLYSACLYSKFNLDGRAYKFPGRKTEGILVGDAELREVLGMLKRAVAITLFIKLSDPDVATPILWPMMIGAEQADISDIVKKITLHYETGRGSQRQMSEAGRKWLTGLGITG